MAYGLPLATRESTVQYKCVGMHNLQTLLEIGPIIAKYYADEETAMLVFIFLHDLYESRFWTAMYMLR